jgi:hypothetical protein
MPQQLYLHQEWMAERSTLLARIHEQAVKITALEAKLADKEEQLEAQDAARAAWPRSQSS